MSIKYSVLELIEDQAGIFFCPVSLHIINDGMGSIVRDRLNAPHMDVWIYDVD